jgi:hypothetical protein
MSDSEILARLIYRAFVVPDCPETADDPDALLPFTEAIGLYARIAARETQERLDSALLSRRLWEKND